MTVRDLTLCVDFASVVVVPRYRSYYQLLLVVSKHTAGNLVSRTHRQWMRKMCFPDGSGYALLELGDGCSPHSSAADDICYLITDDICSRYEATHLRLSSADDISYCYLQSHNGDGG